MAPEWEQTIESRCTEIDSALLSDRCSILSFLLHHRVSAPQCSVHFHHVFLFGQMCIMIELNWIDMSVHSLVDVHESAVSSFGRLWASINCLSISNVQVYIALFAVLVFELVTVEFSAHKLTFLFWIRAISVSTCPVDVFDSHERIGNEALFKDYERVHWPTLT